MEEKNLSPHHIQVIAPASAAPLEKLNQAIDWLQRHGFSFELPADLLKPRLFFASPLKNQERLLVRALQSDSPILWCLRGGYGSARLIPMLERMKPPEKKLLIGFSDITALHLFLGQRWNWPTLHGRVLTQLDLKAKRPDLKIYQNLLRGKLKSLTYSGLIPMNQSARKSRVLKGRVTGGNLRLVECSIGTSWELEPKGKILFLEDVGERGYAIHRMLTHLGQAGLLKGLKAIVLGDFTEGLEPDGKDRTIEALEAFAESTSIPVLRGMPCGHGSRNHPLPFNTPATLKLGSRGSLKVEVKFQGL